MAKTNMVITIGRQYGSGGREVGRRLASRLEIPYYDKEILSEASKDSGICEELFEDHDEKPTRSFLYSLTQYFARPINPNHNIVRIHFLAVRIIFLRTFAKVVIIN